jgi:hypothetical protein
VRTYAAATRVSVEQSRVQLERLIAKYGGQPLAAFTPEDKIVLFFRVGRLDTGDRVLRFVIPVPPLEQFRARRGGRGGEVERRAQAVRQRWRVLLLLLKAKFEAVQVGAASFDEEFLGYIVTHSGSTVADQMVKALQTAYTNEGMPRPMLPPASEVAP